MNRQQKIEVLKNLASGKMQAIDLKRHFPITNICRYNGVPVAPGFWLDKLIDSYRNESDRPLTIKAYFEGEDPLYIYFHSKKDGLIISDTFRNGVRTKDDQSERKVDDRNVFLEGIIDVFDCTPDFITPFIPELIAEAEEKRQAKIQNNEQKR